MKCFYVLISAFVLLVSCAGARVSDVGPGEGQSRRVEMNSMELSSKISIEFPDFNNSFQAKIRIAGRDSLSLSAIGPFGIVLGKLYVDSTSFIFYNVMENTVYKGVPNEDNLYKAAKIRLNFNDLVSIMRNETPDLMENYKVFKNDEDQTIFIHNDKSKFAEFFLWGKADNRIKQYQRKDLNDNLMMNVFLSNPETIEGFKIAQNMSIVFPATNGKLLIDHISVDINKTNEDPFHFKIPASAKVYEFK